MSTASLLSLSLLLALAASQQIGTNTAETHPKLTWGKCTASGCATQQASVVLDANWRWLHTTTGFTNCYTGSTWDATLCPDPVTCAKNCAVDGADYSATYGITTSGNALTHKFVTQSAGKNIGSRVYLMDTADTGYQMFKPKNQEFTFDVDVSKLPCGLNGALYFVEMDADGGKAKYPNNKAGAKYGTGYCDSQCPHDIKFINGEANVLDWGGSANDPNSGKGRYGTCCAEMDIWEANSISTAYTPHPCSSTGQTRCSGNDCGDGDNRYGGVCDKDGCDFNSYRLGNQSFYGPGKTVNTNAKLTVVTKFITSDGTATGPLSEIRRLYVQNGVIIQNTKVNVAGLGTGDSVTTDFCTKQKSVFGDTNSFQAKGGLVGMGQAFDRGVTLVMSVWDDHDVNMLWLDSTYPIDKDPATPGVARGSCATTSGTPVEVEANSPNAQVVFSNIRFGDLGSTYAAGTVVTPPGGPTTPPGTTPTAPPASGNLPKYSQCGGIGWTGSGTCVAGTTCKKTNDYYSQCL